MSSLTISTHPDQIEGKQSVKRSRVLPAKSGLGAVFFRLVAAFGLTLLLITFLAVSRWLGSSPPPELTIRTLETIQPVSLPAPPPPPTVETPPPPPPETVPLPKLEIQIDSVAPPIKATLEHKLDLNMTMPDFAPAVDQARERMLFSSKELDSQPRLLNRPTAAFPKSQSDRGVKEGKVTLEVVIGASGNVTVRRVLDTTHPDFTAMARSFATRAKFSPPKKEGRSVSSLFRWPLILKPRLVTEVKSVGMRLFYIFLFFNLITASAEPLPIDPLWKTEGFRKSMTGSYGIDSRIEPRITIDEEEFLNLSAREMAAGNREAAIKILSETSVLETSPTLRFALANLQFEMEKDEAAIKNFRKTLEQFPNFRDAHRNLAIALVQNEKLDDAKTHLIRAIELGSREGLTMGLLGYCHAVDENHQSALQAYRLAQLTMPEEKQWKLGEAQALQSLDQPKAALSLYRNLLSTSPTESPLWLNLANTNLQLGQSLDAVANMEIVRRIGTLPAPSLLSLGNLYLNESLPAESAECYLAALAMSEPPPLEKVVESLEYVTNLGHWEIAKTVAASISNAYREAESPRLKRALALIDFETGDAAAAVSNVEALVDTDPMDGQSLLLLARFRNSEGKREEAEMLMEQAVLIDRHEADALVAHGKLLVEYGEYSAASEKLERALRIQPNDSLREYATAVKQLIVD